MKAIVRDGYGDVEVLRFRDIPEPTIGADEVLVEVRAAGLDPGVWHLMTGRPYLVRLSGFRLRRFPLGVDLAGRVVAVGEQVRGFQPGDEVFGTGHGSFAEHASAAQTSLAAKPASLSFVQAAAVPVSGCTALQGLRDQAKVQAGQQVLIIGAAGGVGTFAVQLAKAFGAGVTGVCSTAKVDLVRSIGADAVIDYTLQDFADGRRRFDVIIDTAGRRPLSSLRRALAPHGALVIVGGEGGGRWLGGFDRGFRGQLLSLGTDQRIRQLTATVNQADLLILGELIESGKLIPVIDRTYPLNEVPEAIRQWEHRHAQGKVVITG